MKWNTKYVLFFLLAFTGLRASAQVWDEDTTSHQPFFKASKFSSRCYVGLDASVVQILKTKAAGNFGVNLNWVINHKFVVSAIYDGTATQPQIQKIVTPGDNSDTIHLVHHYVGLGFGYIVFYNKLFSLQPELNAGWGRIQYGFNNVNYHKDFAEIMAVVSATYNCTKNFRIGLGLNYHIAAGARLNGLTSADISGAGGVIFIKAGTF